MTAINPRRMNRAGQVVARHHHHHQWQHSYSYWLGGHVDGKNSVSIYELAKKWRFRHMLPRILAVNELRLCPVPWHDGWAKKEGRLEMPLCERRRAINVGHALLAHPGIDQPCCRLQSTSRNTRQSFFLIYLSRRHPRHGLFSSPARPFYSSNNNNKTIFSFFFLLPPRWKTCIRIAIDAIKSWGTSSSNV